ncbi:MAG: flagellar biosynthesis protein FlhB [Frankiaceae bacterium]|jgi:flagellar biosynthetic protein FlhB|nr:flagellar biosynthesis protein FlhB [Frankiaceae bacterium]MDQ1649109.1 flagellar biosynthesis protein FlhB [Frankiaceae bacterium]
MADGGGGGEKTEKPTGKKKGELRKEGVVPRSQELPQAISLFVLVVALPIALSNLNSTYSALMASALSQSGTADLSTANKIGWTMVAAGAKAMAIPVLLVMGSIILTNVMVTREKPNPKLLKPRFKSLSPKTGLKRVFSPHGLVEFAKTAVKLTLMIGVGYLAYRRGITHLVSSPAPLEEIVKTTLAASKTLLIQVAVLALVIGFVDVAWAIRKFGKQSKMSKHEVREESKQQEVNPEVKGAIRSRQIKLSRSRMMAAVLEADVVLVNPTHFAVALKYEAGSFAPQIVAKGAGVIAQRIREKAEGAGVPIVRNVPLARALHSSCQIGDSIPVELFRAVAEVLATVYATKRRRGGNFPQVQPQPAT